MEMMTLTQLSQHTNLAPQTLCEYRDDYILYIPAVRVGQTIGFPSEAAPVMKTIHDLTTQGHSRLEVTAELEKSYPITVIAAQPIAKDQQLPADMPGVTGLLRDVDSRYAILNGELSQIREELGKTASEQRAIQIQQMITGAATSMNNRLEPLNSMTSELTQIRQAVGILASRVERQGTTALQDRTDITTSIEELAHRLPTTVPGITDELNAVRLEIADLRTAMASAQPTARENDSLLHISAEIGTLKEQLTDLRRERGQMVSLMSALQDNLAQLHIELADARFRPAPTPLQDQPMPPMLTIPAPVSAAPYTNGNGTGSIGTADLGDTAMRRPRRLGHQGKSLPATT